MAQETMTSEERYQAAISLEKPDRAPIAPIMATPAAAKLLGLKSWEIMAGGFDAEFDTHMKAFNEYGGWDLITPLATPDMFRLVGLGVKDPEEGRPEPQIVEKEVLKLEDYDLIVEMGWEKFVNEVLIYRATPWTPEEAAKQKEIAIAGTFRVLNVAKGKGAAVIFPIWAAHPFFQFSLARSMVKFTEDLYYHPDTVERALKVAVAEYITTIINACKATGTNVANVTEERAGGFFYPPKVFERFWWPSTVEIVNALWSEGIVAWFHLDTCWDKNISYFKQLPRGSAIIDLDGTTNIFAAKEVLRNHLCIASDVHPALLSLGKPEAVEAYCKRLIDEIGGDGGHILSTGCGLPYAVKPENFRAFLETGKTYGLSKK